jgi:two-component system response regulator HydG
VLGESGVGKEVVARLVHEQSRRARGPFVAVNCAAIVDTLVEAELFGIEDRTATGVRGRRGKFEQADGGTLFLDEVGDLAPSAQAKLLRVLQDLTVERVGGHAATPVDVRVVAATNRDLPALVRDGRFRADLYYRLNGVEIEVPPLRTRPEDLPALVAHVLGRHDALGVVGLSDEALLAMHDYPWPGNVRELERVVERALALCDGGCILLDHLPPSISGTYGSVMGPALRDAVSLRAFTARYVRFTVDRVGSRREACRVLGISYHTLRAHLAHPSVRWSDSGLARPGVDGALRSAALVADRAADSFEGEPSGERGLP